VARSKHGDVEQTYVRATSNSTQFLTACYMIFYALIHKANPIG
jgi:hypothetical protein